MTDIHSDPLAYAPAPDEVYRAGYVTACDNATSLDDARLLISALFEEHGKPTKREPRQKRTRRTTEAERRDMYEQWKAGRDLNGIARDYNLAKVTVHTHVKNQATPQELERLTRQPAACGTTSGHKRHQRNGEEACGPCKRAKSDESYERYVPKRARLGRRST